MEIPTPVHHSQSNHANHPSPRVCVIVSRYNHTVTGPMRTAAVETYSGRYGDSGSISVVEAPGTFELTAIATAAIECGAYDGIVTLGCVIRGETDHDRYISQAVASGLTDLTVQTGVPVAFGVITANTPEQAIARAGGADGKTGSNKGAEAMDALLDAIDAMRHLFDTAEDAVPTNFEVSRTSTDKAAASPAGRSN